MAAKTKKPRWLRANRVFVLKFRSLQRAAPYQPYYYGYGLSNAWIKQHDLSRIAISRRLSTYVGAGGRYYVGARGPDPAHGEFIG